MRPALLAALVLMMAAAIAAPQDAPIQVGSKKFTEGVVLGEILRFLAEEGGGEAIHRRELGGTRIVWNALLAGDIDLYAEYTGTLAEEILEQLNLSGVDEIRDALAERGVMMSAPLGFNNTYAIGMRRERALELGIKRISDLRDHPDLVFGFANEFMDRGDGWPSLRNHYALPQGDVRGLDHDLAYRGLEGKSIDAIDVYSTDAEIAYYDLAVLEDDRAHFPRYQAVILYRQDLRQRAPQVVRSLKRLEGAISEDAMIRMNARVKLERTAESKVASEFLAESLQIRTRAVAVSGLSRFWRHTRDHLFLVLISLSGAIAISLPLGILAARHRRFGHAVLAVVGVVQTIPSLALLVFMIPLLGIGAPPAILALFLYSLLPIVRNTYAGLHDIPPHMLESARALGLPSAARLRLVELPLASRSILAGIKTSAVINIGTATLGALIGAGGYGQPILTGIRLDDVALILEGAVPAAVMALAAQGLFDLAERWLAPEGLRLAAAGE